MCAGFPWPFVVLLFSYCCCPGAANCGGGGRGIEVVGMLSVLMSAIREKLSRVNGMQRALRIEEEAEARESVFHCSDRRLTTSRLEYASED